MNKVYSIYKEKLKNGERRSIEERLIALPEREFSELYYGVLNKEAIAATGRIAMVGEVISGLEHLQ